MRDLQAWIRHARRGVASLFSLLLISSPVVAYGQTVTAVWDASPPSDQVTSYEVCIGTASMSCDIQLASVSNTQTTYTLTPSGGVLEYVAVRAINPSGPGSYSSETTFSIPSLTQPVNQSSPVGIAIAPLNLTVSDPDGSAKTFAHTGLPTGLSINASSGQITGTPSAAGTYNVTVFVTDSLVTVSRSFVWTVTAATADTTAPALAITSHTDGQTKMDSTVVIAGTATDSGRGGNGVSSVIVNGQPATGGTVSGNGTASWSRAVTLSPGANTITVQATDGRGNVATQSITLNLAVTPVTSATLTANLASPQNTGTPVTFTAGGMGGTAPHQFKFLVQQSGGSAQVVQNWSTAATYTWTPTTAAGYSVIVWARSAGATVDAAQASAQMSYVVNSPPVAPVTTVALSASLPSPQDAGTAITFTAVGAGGVAPRQYKFLVSQGGGANQLVQDWSSLATYTWAPSSAGTYTVTVWARSAGVTTDAAQASGQVAYVINTLAPASVTGASLTPNVATPQVAGTPITFTAGGSGGVAPYQFKFFVQQVGGALQTVQNWSTAATYTWTPTTVGTYTVSVWARSAGVTTNAAQASAQVTYVVNPASIAPVTSATLTPSVVSPQNVGTAIGLTASGAGGVGPREFKFFVQPSGGSAQVVRDWSTTAAYTWTPATAGTYTLIAWARSAGVTVDAAQASAQLSFVISATAAPLTITSFTSSVASPRVAGTSIRFNAVASGGTAPYQFKWWVSDGSSWRVVQEWGASGTFDWVPSAAGEYTVAVWARNSGVTTNASQALAQVAYTITSTAPTQPLAITSLTSNLASPQMAGATITFNAVATGGQAPYQFKWWIYDGVSWRVAQNWSSSSTLNWRPTAAGDYMVAVWARNNGVTLEASQAMGQVFYTVTNAPVAPSAAPLTISGITSNATSPSILGTTVTFSAAATGGTAPYQFKWWVFDGASWRTAQDWSNAATFNWRPAAAGTYMVAVWARSNGVTKNASEALAQTEYTIVGTAAQQPLAITSFTSNLASPQPAGTTVTFSTAASGGQGAYEFKWWIFDGTSWKVGQKWSPSTTFNWRPSAPGTYMVAVWARNAGVKVDASQALAQTVFTIN